MAMSDVSNSFLSAPQVDLSERVDAAKRLGRQEFEVHQSLREKKFRKSYATNTHPYVKSFSPIFSALNGSLPIYVVLLPFMHLFRLLVDIAHFLCVRKADVPVPRWRTRTFPIMSMPRDRLFVGFDLGLASCRTRTAVELFSFQALATFR